jgi:mono/diheme cytochrome c family protein
VTTRPRFTWLGVCLATLLVLLACSARAADVERGRAIYEGRLDPRSANGEPARSCVACHRPSGMGNFEGGLAVPPITGASLFQAFDRDLAHFFVPSQSYRVRPAYDEAALARVLRTGLTPDGAVLHPAMPRYRIDDADVGDLVAYLRQLSARTPPGLDGTTVRLATVTTPDVDPARRAAMLETLRQFIEQKNGGSRLEVRRSEVAQRTNYMAMARKYRLWQIEHWALTGDAATWGAQLDALQARQPVYALVAGLGGAEWAPVDAFCERHRLPCVLPLTQAAPARPDLLYSVHYHAGIGADAELAAHWLQGAGATAFELRSDPADPAAQQIVRATLVGAGLTELVGSAGGHAPLVSLLPPAVHASGLAAVGTGRAVVWLPGAHALGQGDVDAALRGTREGLIVTPMLTGQVLERRLLRARTWMAAKGLADAPADVAASTLFAATVFGETLAHIDFAFTPEYLLERVEHSLENMVPWSPYPRLALGPGQRIGSKGSWVGAIRQGSIDWTWQSGR